MANPLHDRLFAPQEGRDAPFLILPDGREISHAGFADRAARIARALRDLELEPGDRMAVQVDKCPDMLAVYAAAVRTGVVFLPLNTAYTPAEMDYFVGDSGAKVLLAAPERVEGLAQVAEKNGAWLETLGPGGTGSLAAAAEAAGPLTEVTARGEDDLAAILYTSGTTGRSKGAMVSHRNLLSNAGTLAEAWGFTDRDVLLHALPVFHTHGLFVATNVALLTGGAMIFLPKFETGAVLDALPRATAMMGVPTFYTRLLADDRFTCEAAGHVRLFVSGSAPLLAETHRAFEERTGSRILERYGMTETNMNTSNPLDGERRAGTVGPALPGVEVRVCDAEGRELPRGEIGTVEVRGPNVFLGYWRMPEKTAEEMRPDGFFITGDLGQMSGDGYLTIVGRAKDLVISGGLNVYPKEVEEALDAAPGVAESAVIGVPHPDLGEAVVAVVTRAEGAAPDPDAILAGLGDLAPFKRPKRVIVVDALPRNTMGKVQKAALRETYGDLFA